ncbi:hypothetical protein NX786_09170 [Telluria mixta]|uniref:Uncharacterized protein n=1 Tax=Telluria mixta TaxID=34071 RepID=A0ABT2BWJ3_9BURK|nr:hypothetical protein [Telluria mixta]MCS0629503.1 hypothetical protein [Telluria mixta]WEM96922.1 hypothetical protein P0M04_04040 [Telluria mixta]
MVLVTVSVFAVLALTLAIEGNSKAAAGAFIITILLAPLLFEAIWPGKYTLRKPDGDMEDNLVNRLRQFRADHPGLDGTILLGVMILLGIGLIADMLVRFVRLF